MLKVEEDGHDPLIDGENLAREQYVMYNVEVSETLRNAVFYCMIITKSQKLKAWAIF